MTLYLKENFNPLYLKMPCAKFTLNLPSGFWEEHFLILSMHFRLRRRWKCEKFTDRQTDNGQQENRKAHLSFQLRWAKNVFAQYLIVPYRWLKGKKTFYPCWKLNGSYLLKVKMPSQEGCFMVRLVEIGAVVLEKIFKFCQCILRFCYYLPLEKCVALHSKKLNHLHQGMLCAKFDWN